MITPAYSVTATERVLPKLALDFTTATLDPRVTFTRAGNTATYINSSGYVTAINANLPRFDYDPVTLICNGLLIEEARTNLISYSDFSGGWTFQGVTTVNNVAGVTAPSGQMNALSLVENSTSSTRHGMYFTTAGSNTAHTFSAFVKQKSGSRYIRLSLSSSSTNFGCADFDPRTGAVVQVLNSGTITGTTAATSALGNGWYRVSVTTIVAVSNPVICLTDSPTAAAGSAFGFVAYTSDNTSGVYMYGSQLEAGAFATSYIPAVAATVTRNADVATMTGTNFSDFWQAGEGGALAQVTPSTVSGVRPLVQFDDGTANEIIALRGNTTNPELYIVDGGTPQAQLDAGTIAANTAYNLTGWWSTNDCKARQDAGAVVTDTTATIPTVTQMRIGSDGTNYLTGTIATIGYYDSFFGQPIYTRRKNKVSPSLL